MEEILASIRRIIADDDALPLMRRPSLVTREPAAAPDEHRTDLPRYPAAPASSAPPVHLVAVAAAESELAEPTEDSPMVAIYPEDLAAGERGDAAADHGAGEHELRPSIADEFAAEGPSAPAAAQEPRVPVSRAMTRDREERANAPLISASTDASVASSFQSLATSMFLRDSDLLARTAREMLRPMLKAWLDDNLPVMVERLVRAEIERVARGGR
jgi:cell pole-organizing protein PopZ